VHHLPLRRLRRPQPNDRLCGVVRPKSMHRLALRRLLRLQSTNCGDDGHPCHEAVNIAFRQKSISLCYRLNDRFGLQPLDRVQDPVPRLAC
jgi:hypothetical protein